MTVRRVDRDQLLAFRLDSHHLSHRQPLAALHEVVGACGIRNTPPGSAALALHARVAELTPSTIDRALAEDKTLVEVLAMRASPHLVPVDDVAVFTLGALPADEESLRLALTAIAPALSKAGMSATEALQRAADVTHEALADGLLTRSVLSTVVSRQLPEVLVPWCAACGVHHVSESLFRLVGVRGVWVIVPRGSKGAVYMRSDEWLGGAIDGDRGAARAELLRRYLRCYGPSTAAHFAAWVGITSAEAQGCWDQLAEQLIEVTLDDRRAWLHAADLTRFEHPAATSGVRLLPAYDSYLDQRDRATLLPDATLHRRVWRVVSNPGVVLVDGAIVGLWRSQKKGKRLVVSVEPFTPLSRQTRAEIEAEAALIVPYRGCTSAEITFAESA